MSLEYDYFYKINNGTGSDSLAEIDITEAKRRLRQQLQTSNHFDPAATRNGVTQGFVVTASDSYYKYKIEALPDEELHVGDMIVTHGEHWIVVNTRVASPYQTIGLMWLCNHLFRWQNGTSRIVERWGVLDSGVYSSTRDGDKTVMTADKQYKIYLPSDEDTRMLHVNKRFATEIVYNQELDQILNVFEVTGFDSVSRSYGSGGHLLILNARSADYIADRDNLAERICDYIAPGSDPGPTGDLQINGSHTIRIGSQRTYTVDITHPVWTMTASAGVTSNTSEDGALTVCAAFSEDLVGTVVSISVTDGTNTGALDVEVVT